MNAPRRCTYTQHGERCVFDGVPRGAGATGRVPGVGELGGTRPGDVDEGRVLCDAHHQAVTDARDAIARSRRDASGGNACTP